jgi:hypothetical protein
MHSGWLALTIGLAALAIGWRIHLTDRPSASLRVGFIVIAAVFLWVSSCALARAESPAERLRPPPEYRGRAVIAVVKTMDLAEVRRECAMRSGNPRALACSFGRTILVPLRGQVSDETFLALLEHEQAHILGWTHP